MPLTPEQKHELFRLLESRGWYWEGETICSPGESMGFWRDDPWDDLLDFWETMTRRLDRIRRRLDTLSGEERASWQLGVDDTNELVECLTMLIQKE
jgi:hypothetical protein